MLPPVPDIITDEAREAITKLAGMMCSVEEIAAVTRVPALLIKKYCKDELTDGLHQGRASLRRMQWVKARDGNVPMLIWLGKQMLGQSDKVQSNSEVTSVIRVVDV